MLQDNQYLLPEFYNSWDSFNSNCTISSAIFCYVSNYKETISTIDGFWFSQSRKACFGIPIIFTMRPWKSALEGVEHVEYRPPKNDNVVNIHILKNYSTCNSNAYRIEI